MRHAGLRLAKRAALTICVRTLSQSQNGYDQGCDRQENGEDRDDEIPARVAVRSLPSCLGLRLLKSLLAGRANERFPLEYKDSFGKGGVLTDEAFNFGGDPRVGVLRLVAREDRPTVPMAR